MLFLLIFKSIFEKVDAAKFYKIINSFFRNYSIKKITDSLNKI